MARDTAISWAGATWNVITGCTVLSPGCQRCYAMKLAGGRMRNHWSRQGLTVDTKNGPVWNGEVRFNRAWLDQPLTWKAPTAIFVCAHSDLFHEGVPDEWIDEIFAVIARCPRHLFMVLTKRIARAREYITARNTTGGIDRRIADRVIANEAQHKGRGLEKWPAWPLPNVWLGTSIEDQPHADLRLPDLLATPAALHWVSVEPMLGAVDLSPWLFDRLRLDDVPGYMLNDAPGAEFVKPSGKIGLVIAGGESQRGARWLPPPFVRFLRDQCAAAGTVFHFKQWGAWLPRDQVTNDAQRSAEDKAIWQTPDSSLGPRDIAVAYNVGPTIAGHLLDGVEYREMPPWGEGA